MEKPYNLPRNFIAKFRKQEFEEMAETVKLAVNGTLMRGLELHPNLESLSDGEETLGVLGEPILCQSQHEITDYGGWRNYIAGRTISK